MNDDEIDRVYGIKRLSLGRSYALILALSAALWGVIFGVVWAVI